MWPLITKLLVCKVPSRKSVVFVHTWEIRKPEIFRQYMPTISIVKLKSSKGQNVSCNDLLFTIPIVKITKSITCLYLFCRWWLGLLHQQHCAVHFENLSFWPCPSLCGQGHRHSTSCDLLGIPVTEADKCSIQSNTTITDKNSFYLTNSPVYRKSGI